MPSASGIAPHAKGILFEHMKPAELAVALSLAAGAVHVRVFARPTLPVAGLVVAFSFLRCSLFSLRCNFFLFPTDPTYPTYPT